MCLALCNDLWGLWIFAISALQVSWYYNLIYTTCFHLSSIPCSFGRQEGGSCWIQAETILRPHDELNNPEWDEPEDECRLWQLSMPGSNQEHEEWRWKQSKTINKSKAKRIQNKTDSGEGLAATAGAETKQTHALHWEQRNLQPRDGSSFVTSSGGWWVEQFGLKVG